MKKIITVILILFNLQIFAQQSKIHHSLDWSVTSLTFIGASYTKQLPYFTKVFPVSKNVSIFTEISNRVFEPLEIESIGLNVSEEIEVQSWVDKVRKSYVGTISFLPIRKVGGRYEKLVSFDLSYRIKENSTVQPRGPENTYTSILSNGDIYKIGISKAGIYQLDYQYLKDSLGIDVDNLDPKTIQLYGSGGGKVPQKVGLPRVDDLIEIPILVQGESDGKFDASDKVLFFAESADTWKYDLASEKYNYINNPYDNFNYYFIKINGDTGKRVFSVESQDDPTYASTECDALVHFEEDLHNLLHERRPTHGSGTRWYGDKFTELSNEKSYNFEIPDLNKSEPIDFEVNMLGRSNRQNKYKVTIGSENFESKTIGSVSLDSVEGDNAFVSVLSDKIISNTNKISLKLQYPLYPGNSLGMLDYITLVGRQLIKLRGNQTIFRDKRSIGKGVCMFTIQNTNSNSEVWDITDALEPVQRKTINNGGQSSFSLPVEGFNTFIVFDKTSNFSNPVTGKKIANQNVHKYDDVDMVIISPEIFFGEAKRLAKHRNEHDGLKVEVINVHQIYNEFSSGRQDPVALRDFVKMISDRNIDFRYVLLFGDGSFDFRNIYKSPNPANYIPVFETDSFYPLASYPSDDFYGLISEGEGDRKNNSGPVLHGAIDLAVGRLTAKSLGEAKHMVSKIINYEANQSSFRNWRNKMIFVADDEDGNLHLDPVEDISIKIDTTETEINIEKIYLDAFPQVSTSGGEKFPAATEAINKAMFKGGLVINYMGHGGPTGWAQERVLRLKDIDGWKNKNALPLFITATCSFTSFDDFSISSPGERILYNANGGGIGLFSTVRAVFAGQNEKLTKSVFNALFTKDSNGNHYTMGEILRDGKNHSGASVENSRKFSLFGDPSMKLAFPEYDVVTTLFNGQSVAIADTIGAFEKVKIQGQIEDNGKLMTSFNGTVAVTVYDKPVFLKTLGQDSGSIVKSFKLQKNIIFNGVVSVTNGKFSYEFIVPKDINYSFGYGKISYYAWTNSLDDANGVFTNFVVGGGSNNVNTDDLGPKVDVFMNDESFIFGGITDENPILLAKIKDDSGINLTGSSIGHNLTAVLDDNEADIYQLNDFYTGDVDDYTSGTVRYPLFDIPTGRHKVKVTAWDIANNSAEGYTEFVVANSEKMALQHVLNYPNPFTIKTNFQFEHNYPGQLIKVQVRVFSVSGRLVKTIEKETISDSYRIDDIAWNGDDDFGNPLAKGVYLYKVKIGVENGGEKISTESNFEKLVILK